MRRLAVAVFAGLVALTPILAAAQGQNSAIQGRVVDESGAVLPGVIIVVTHEGSGMSGRSSATRTDRTTWLACCPVRTGHRRLTASTSSSGPN